MPSRREIAARRIARAAADRDRLRHLVREGALAARRVDRALTRDPAADVAWVGRRLTEAIDALHRARNRAVLLRSDVTATVELD